MVSGVANFSRSLAASASGCMVPTAPISTTILPAAAWSFFTSSAYTSSRSSQRVRGSMRPMMPKSKNTIGPVVDVEVAGVQVAVEQAVPQAALEEAEQQRLDQLGAVESGLADGGDVVDADALHPLHRQHPLAGQIPVHLRHTDVLAQRRGVQVRDPGVHRLRLEPEVQLLGQVVGEVGDHVLGGQPAAQLGQLDELARSA